MSASHQSYLAERQLKKGTAGWILLAGPGVSYVISGDFSGWNFGIAQAGRGGFAIATVLMATMYLTNCQVARPRTSVPSLTALLLSHKIRVSYIASVNR